MMSYTFRPMENAFRVLAWGRGVPSTTLAIMSALGYIERLDAVIHANPGWEHYATNDLGEHFTGVLRSRGLHVEELMTGDIHEEGAAEHIHMPFWVPSGGQLRRQCSREFKIRPQRRRIREMLGYHPSLSPAPPAGTVEQWIGFTRDELHRMRGSGVQFIVNRWPLIEKGMTRTDCVKFLVDHGMPIPPPSSCIGCPYKDAPRWAATSQDELAEAIEFDNINRYAPTVMREDVDSDALYIYKGLKPLAEARFEDDMKQTVASGQMELFGCEEGYCGL